ncbi:MAG: hypothetical protein NTW32_03785 [Chloroflexi bacterium]|nr:hypothetical protein [Chloroflexota bacterium]
MGIQAIGNSTSVDLSTMARSRSATTTAASTSTTSGTESQVATQNTGVAPPAKVGGVAKPVETSVSSSSTNGTSSLSLDKIYDKRDANQDGTVSYQEELLFSLKQTTSETQNQAAVTTNQIQAGLNAYKQGQQANSTSLSSPLFAI